jgi:hypothetical protein
VAGSLLQESLLSPSSAGGFFFFSFLSESKAEEEELELEQDREGYVVFILDANLENF